MKIGIDIGGSHIGVGLINNDNTIVAKEEMELVNISQGIENIIIETIVKFINRILENNHLSIQDIEIIGIASPGTVTDSEIVKAHNLGLKNFKILEELRKYFDVPMKLKNDAKCAAVAEKKCGSLREYNNCIFLAIGTGIGGAVFWNGKLLRPTKYPGFEVGHMIIQKENARECKCGKSGCFEQYASITALKREIREKYSIQEEMTGKELYNFITENMQDERMNQIIGGYLNDLALGISNLINIFEPEVIGIGGSFSHYKDIFLPQLKIKTERLLFNNDMPKIVMAQIKNDAGIIGAV